MGQIRLLQTFLIPPLSVRDSDLQSLLKSLAPLTPACIVFPLYLYHICNVVVLYLYCILHCSCLSFGFVVSRQSMDEVTAMYLHCIICIVIFLLHFNCISIHHIKHVFCILHCICIVYLSEIWICSLSCSRWPLLCYAVWKMG